jgi:hypothetical protein
MVQMETADETAEADKASERFLFSEECQLITFMSVVRGKLEVTRCQSSTMLFSSP